MASGLGIQAISFVGALLILIAYVGHQAKWMRSGSKAYNLLNFFGSALLLYVAFYPFQVGFVMLEAVWALVSIWALVRSPREAKSA